MNVVAFRIFIFMLFALLFSAINSGESATIHRIANPLNRESIPNPPNRESTQNLPNHPPPRLCEAIYCRSNPRTHESTNPQKIRTIGNHPDSSLRGNLLPKQSTNPQKPHALRIHTRFVIARICVRKFVAIHRSHESTKTNRLLRCTRFARAPRNDEIGRAHV